jgi:hypothetical protein
MTSLLVVRTFSHTQVPVFTFLPELLHSYSVQRYERRGECNKNHLIHCHSYLPEFTKVHTIIL